MFKSVSIIGLMLWWSSVAVAQDPLAGPREAVNTGAYAGARSELIDLVGQSEEERGQAVFLLVDTYLATGEYEEGLDAFARLQRRLGEDPYLYHAQGELFRAMGRYQEAEAAYVESAGILRDNWRNLVSLAELLETTGRSRQAREVYAFVYRPYQNNEFRTVDDLLAGAKAAARLGEFQDANSAHNTAYQLDAQHVANLVAWGNLFREKYNNADAERTLEEALAINSNYAPLYVALAQSGGGYARKEQLVRTALEKNPAYTPAMAILAGLHILDSEYDAARSVIAEGLELNPAALDLMAQKATIAFLHGDSTLYVATEGQAKAINPSPSEFYRQIAANLDLKFRYPDAVSFARQAVLADRRNAAAHAQLGTSLLRLGDGSSARRYLESSFDLDPYSMFVGNTLTLLDEHDEVFTTLESEHFILLINREERSSLGPALLELAETAYATLTDRYPYEPEERILIEAYNDPDDFAVRIGGVPHLGLLGVSFGDVLALNSPKGQPVGSYNWARTLWHELTHTLSIGAAQYRLPRWMAEGLAVYEEQRARKEWGREMEIQFIQAFEADKLLPLDEMDRGFTRPTYEGQILMSYYHAGRVVKYIVDTYGFDVIAQTLQSLALGMTDVAAIEAATGVSLDVIENGFRASVRDEQRRLASVMDGYPNPFGGGGILSRPQQEGEGNELLETLKEGNGHLSAGNLSAAESSFKKALNLFPAFTEPGNAYQGLAGVYRAQGDQAALMDILEQYLEVNEHGLEEARELGRLYQEAGRQEEAIRYYERSLDVYPYERDIQAELSTLYGNVGRHQDAVRSRRAILDLDPIDRADAFYQLALSLEAAGQSREAKRAVLQSLELAPGYRDAQRFLLALVEPTDSQ